MLKKKAALICFVIIFSCNSQKTSNKMEGERESEVISDRIAAFLQERNFEVLKNSNLGIEYKIQKTLLKGTNKEYSNKLFLKDTLDNLRFLKLRSFLENDKNYDWNTMPNNKPFEPNRQFLIKSSSGRLTILLEESGDRMGFINLDGQKIVALSEDFSNFLQNL